MLKEVIKISKTIKLEPVIIEEKDFLANLRIKLNQYFSVDVKNLDDAEKWFKKYGLFTDDEDGVLWIIKIWENNEWKPVGALGLNGINHQHRHAEFGRCMMLDKYSGQGIFFKAAKAVIKQGFKNLNLHSIFLEVYADNHKAIKIYKALGFEKEGIRRDYWFKNGKFCNASVMSILKK